MKRSSFSVFDCVYLGKFVRRLPSVWDHESSKDNGRSSRKCTLLDFLNTRENKKRGEADVCRLFGTIKMARLKK